MARKEKHNLSGKQVGYWLVTEESIRERGRRKWKCICQCGTERFVDEQNLRSERSRSCGCSLANSSKTRIKDLTGQTFGRLTVLGQGKKNKSGRICWICRCACGKLTMPAGHELVTGKTKSCGCLRKEPRRNQVDLKGKKIGRLTALRASEQRSYKGCILWHCRCECGRELAIASDDLTSGRYVSCGCKRSEHQKHLHETLHRVDHTCIEYLEKRNHRRDNTSGHQGVQCL